MDLVVLNSQLLLDCETVIFFFLVFFLLFFLCQFLSYFLDVVFASLPVSLTPPTLPPICSRQEGTTILFCSRSSVRLFRVLGLRKKKTVCGLKDFALIDVLVSWKLWLKYWTADNRLKDWNILSTAFGKRASSFSPKKNNSKNRETNRV